MRKFQGYTAIAVAIWAAAATAFHLYTASIGFWEPLQQRAMHLFWFLPLAFILYPAHRTKSPLHRPSVIDCLLALISITPAIFAFVNANYINDRLENVDPLSMTEIAFGTVATLLVIEILRRAVTPALAGLLAVALAYLFICEDMPGILHSRDIPFEEIVETMFMINGQGMFGMITGISATLVAIFIAYGAFVEKTGLGRFFNNFGTRIAGQYSGGPAKVAVVTSALFGTLSGSSSANVFTTGSFTIPMMKKLGYRAKFAGGVEAAASVGGQSAPPIMGVGAFIMAEITNTPYVDIIIAAILGSMCYFTMVLVSVHLEAKRLGLVGMSRDEIPTWRTVGKDIYLLIPVVVLLVLLLARYSAHFSAFYSIIALVVVVAVAETIKTFVRLRKVGFANATETFVELAQTGAVNLFNTLVTAGKNNASIAIACIGASMLVAALNKAGIPPAFSTIIVSASDGVLWIAAILISIATLLLGMGVPTTAAYVITASVTAPTLYGEFGVPLLAAHMFVFYFATLADATPPVSIASYAAASIAKADPLATGIQAARLAMAGYIVGFSYIYAPELRMEGTIFEIVPVVLCIITGLSITAIGFTGYMRGPVAWPFRMALIPVGLAVSLLHEYPDLLRLFVAMALLAALYYRPNVFAMGKAWATPQNRAKE